MLQEDKLRAERSPPPRRGPDSRTEAERGTKIVFHFCVAGHVRCAPGLAMAIGSTARLNWHSPHSLTAYMAVDRYADVQRPLSGYLRRMPERQLGAPVCFGSCGMSSLTRPYCFLRGR